MRWTYRAAVKARLLPDYGGVGVLPLNDQLYDIASTLGMPGVSALPELDGWVRTRQRPAVRSASRWRLRTGTIQELRAQTRLR